MIDIHSHIIFDVDDGPKNFEDSKKADHQLFAKAHGLLLQEGVYIAPSQYESNFLSSAHSYEDLDRTLAAFDKAFSQL